VSNWRMALIHTLGITCRACYHSGGGQFQSGPTVYVIPLDEIKPGDALRKGFQVRRRAAALRHYKQAHPELVARFFGEGGPK
jgi:hypothetical protein